MARIEILEYQPCWLEEFQIIGSSLERANMQFAPTKNRVL